MRGQSRGSQEPEKFRFALPDALLICKKENLPPARLHRKVRDQLYNKRAVSTQRQNIPFNMLACTPLMLSARCKRLNNSPKDTNLHVAGNERETCPDCL